MLINKAIDEIRKTHHEISAKYHYDTKELLEHYKHLEGNLLYKGALEMKQGKYIKDEKLLKQGVDILMEKLGPIGTSRFLSFPPQKRI